MTAQLAAIIYSAGFPIDELMASVALRLKHGTVRLGGVVQHNADDPGHAMALEDLASGTRFAITVERGAHASGCRLDLSGLAAAGGAVTAALAGPVDMLIINKFGRQEALGQGLRAEIAAGLMSGLPLLIAVRDDMLPAWREFAGDDWQELAPEAAAIEAWAGAHLSRAA